MLTDWIHWLSYRHPEQLASLVMVLLLTEAPRYTLSRIALCLSDCVGHFWRYLRGTSRPQPFSYCPSVCVILAGHNEEETLEATLHSVWGSYPRLEIIVVDDGSTDSMAEVARRFSHDHDGVMVLGRPERGGKSSAMNFALPYVRSEIVVVVDADSHLGPSAIWEIVQPLQDPKIGAVAGTVLARNPFTNLATWMQSYEYLSSIFVGRMLAAALDVLGIISGAFGAFRRTVLEGVGGWDVGPPEDLDLTLTIRKAGYSIAFSPYAECYTELPTTWWSLFKQRLRWERSGVIRNHCRKHLDMAFFWTRNFRLTNAFVLLESWIFNVFCLYGIAVWIIWFTFRADPDSWKILLTFYACYLAMEVVQFLTIVYFSGALRRDLLICSVFMLVPLYQVFLYVVRLIATTEEIFVRKSFQDNYVPAKVRAATWHW